MLRPLHTWSFVILLFSTSAMVGQIAKPQTTGQASYENATLGFRVLYPALLSQKSDEDLITAMKRFGSTTDPDFLSEGTQNALSPACVHTLFHAKTPKEARMTAPVRRGTEQTEIPVHLEIIVSRFDKRCLQDKFGPPPTDRKERIEFEALLEKLGPAEIADALVRGYGFNPLTVIKRNSPGYTRMENFNAVQYALEGHPAFASIGQVTPNQSYDVAKGEKPPTTQWWDDIRTITAFNAVINLKGELILVQSFAGPVAIIDTSREVKISFSSGNEIPIFRFPK